MTSAIESFVNSIDDLEIANESQNLLDISPFLEDPQEYLDRKFAQNPSGDYAAVLRPDGLIVYTVHGICKDLIKVNAYSEALTIYNALIEIIEKMLPSVPSSEKSVFESSITDLKAAMNETVGLRDEYTSLRKSTITRYAGILDKIKAV